VSVIPIPGTEVWKVRIRAAATPAQGGLPPPAADPALNWLVGKFLQVESKLDDLHELLRSRRKDSYTVEEVAELTGRSQYTVRRWIAEGKLRAIRLAEGGPRGRLLIARAELDNLLAQGKGAQIPAAALADGPGPGPA
jgi:excisionase family DNA binding protein